MIYTVVSTPTADGELTLLWINAADRMAVTRASARIQRALRHDADQKGMLLGDGTRLYTDSPLAVTFE